MTPAVGDDFLLSLPHVSSISLGTGRCLSLGLLLVIVYERFCLFVSQSILVRTTSGLQTLTCAAYNFLARFYLKSEHLSHV